MSNKITKERLLELLTYNPETGVFTWKAARGVAKVNQVAGSVNKAGFRTIRLDNKFYPAHALVWLAENGEHPAGRLKHKNDMRDDNRITNLELRAGKASKVEYTPNKKQLSEEGLVEEKNEDDEDLLKPKKKGKSKKKDKSKKNKKSKMII